MKKNREAAAKNYGGDSRQTGTGRRGRSESTSKKSPAAPNTHSPVQSDVNNLAFRRLELDSTPLDTLQTALYEFFYYNRSRLGLRIERDQELPATIIHVRLYIKDDRQILEEDADVYLGHIRLTRLSSDVTQIELDCQVRGQLQLLYEDLVRKWKAHAATYPIVSDAVHQRDKGKGLYRRKKGKPGRPSLPEDIFAWQQVRIFDRPQNEVMNEWLSNESVQQRFHDQKDARDHFARFIKRNKMGD